MIFIELAPEPKCWRLLVEEHIANIILKAKNLFLFWSVSMGGAEKKDVHIFYSIVIQKIVAFLINFNTTFNSQRENFAVANS